MNKETLLQKDSAISLKIQNNKIEAVFKSNNTHTGVRVYDNGYIGIGGGIGNLSESDLEKKATDMLKVSIPYPVQPTKNAKKTLDLSNEFSLSDQEFIDTTQKLLDALSKNYPVFSFSQHISLDEYSQSLKNDCGTDLFYKDKLVSINLAIKHKKSLNMFDGMISSVTRGFCLEDAYAACTKNLDAYDNKIDIEPECVMPVIFYNNELTGFFSQHLNGKLFAAKASAFSDKLGQKLFSDRFSLCINKDSKSNFGCFFDGEGTVLDGNKAYLIKDGVFVSPYASKKVAQELGLGLTASASSVYDSVPDTSPDGMQIVESNSTLDQLLGGKKAILIEIAAGGDYTPQGEFSTPAQIAYLYQDGKKIGRLPQISLSGSVYDLFGKDFIGKATDGPYKNSPVFKYTAFNMAIRKIGGHQ